MHILIKTDRNGGQRGNMSFGIYTQIRMRRSLSVLRWEYLYGILFLSNTIDLIILPLPASFVPHFQIPAISFVSVHSLLHSLHLTHYTLYLTRYSTFYPHHEAPPAHYSLYCRSRPPFRPPRFSTDKMHDPQGSQRLGQSHACRKARLH